MNLVAWVRVGLVIAFFLGMGSLALAAPERIVRIFGMTTTAEGRNEVRAVYGGFGVAMAVLLSIASFEPHGLGPGIRWAVAGALLGMAGGRVVGVFAERPRSFYPVGFFLVLELVLAGLLVPL